LEVFLKGQHFGTLFFETLLWRRKKILQHMSEKNAPFTIFILGENKFLFCEKKALLHVGSRYLVQFLGERGAGS
jgi:hypothetical protein